MPEGSVRGWGVVWGRWQEAMARCTGGTTCPWHRRPPLHPAVTHSWGAAVGSHPAWGARAGRALLIPFVPPFPHCTATADLLLRSPAQLVALLLLGSCWGPRAVPMPPVTPQGTHTTHAAAGAHGDKRMAHTRGSLGIWHCCLGTLSPAAAPLAHPLPPPQGAQPAGAAAQRVPGHQGLCAAGLQRRDHVPVPDKVPPRAGEPGREPSGVCVCGGGGCPIFGVLWGFGGVRGV